MLQHSYLLGKLGGAEHMMNWIIGEFKERPYDKVTKSAWPVALDILDEDDRLVIKTSLPGVQQKDIAVTIEDRVLSIDVDPIRESEQTERDYVVHKRETGLFHQSFYIPNTLETEKTKSVYEDGILSISIPKLETKKAVRIQVEAAA